jgi:hypothetical protein
MNATVEDILQKVRIPKDDGRLNQALAELDSKLAAWSGAIQHTQSSLRDIIRHQPVPPAEESVSARIESIEESPSNAGKEQPAPAATEDSTVPENTGVCKVSKEPEIPAATPAPAASTDSGGDDEALLATLDPKTAQRIQVLRRLSGQKKSVRELLETHHMGSAPTVPTQPNKKGFWRR